MVGEDFRLQAEFTRNLPTFDLLLKSLHNFDERITEKPLLEKLTELKLSDKTVSFSVGTDLTVYQNQGLVLV